MNTKLIDAEGRIWGANDMRLRSKFSVPNDLASFPSYCVRNFGFVYLKMAKRSCALEVCANQLSLLSYAQAVNVISDFGPDRISLSWFDGVWHHEINADQQRVFGRLLSFVSNNRDRTEHRFRSASRDPNSISASSAFRDLLDVWRDQSQSLQYRKYPQVLHNTLASKYSVVRREVGSAKLTYTDIGDGIAAYRNRGWMNCSLDGDVSDQPDLVFGKFVERCYREAMLAGEPTLTLVDGFIKDPSVNGSGLMRVGYARLALPIYIGSDCDGLLCASIRNDRGIDLFGRIHDEAE